MTLSAHHTTWSNGSFNNDCKFQLEVAENWDLQSSGDSRVLGTEYRIPTNKCTGYINQ